ARGGARATETRRRGHGDLGSRISAHDGRHPASQRPLIARPMRSMTGYGVGEAPLGEGRLTLEVRALNHRFVDVRVRLPVELSDYSFFTEQQARELLSRGRFDIGVRVDDAALPPPSLSVARARSIYLALQSLRDELCPDTELPITAVTTLPELIQAPSSLESEQIQKALGSALSAAVAHLNL